jgi:hypothetical protein
LIASVLVSFITALHYMRIFNSWVNAYGYKPTTNGSVLGSSWRRAVQNIGLIAFGIGTKLLSGSRRSNKFMPRVCHCRWAVLGVGWILRLGHCSSVGLSLPMSRPDYCLDVLSALEKSWDVLWRQLLGGVLFGFPLGAGTNLARSSWRRAVQNIVWIASRRRSKSHGRLSAQ